ncbi:probable RNA-directed DNA polymerase from transposon X-element [Trichonephila clavipes]|nr:probable RNA-directed DNA polymerase from transposon X-element [Trichonephila clavipes]
MLKNLPILPIFTITNIIENMFKLSYFPNAWKTASVVPILKPDKDATNVQNYRLISSLPILSKVAEKIILNRMTYHFLTNNLFIPEQHGFRAELSTSHQLLRTIECIKSGKRPGKHIGAVFLDIQRSFDRVWHTGLLYKLINYDFLHPLILLINSYLTNRNFAVKISNTLSLALDS